MRHAGLALGVLPACSGSCIFYFLKAPGPRLCAQRLGPLLLSLCREHLLGANRSLDVLERQRVGGQDSASQGPDQDRPTEAAPRAHIFTRPLRGEKRCYLSLPEILGQLLLPFPLASPERERS